MYPPKHTPDPESALGQMISTEVAAASSSSSGKGGISLLGVEDETKALSKSQSMEAPAHTIGVDLDQDTSPSNIHTAPAQAQTSTAPSSPMTGDGIKSMNKTEKSTPSDHSMAFGTVIPAEVDVDANTDVAVDADVDITGDVDVSADADAELNLSRHSQESEVSRVSIEVVEADTMALEDILDTYPPQPEVNSSSNVGDSGVSASGLGTSSTNGASGKAAMMTTTGPESSSTSSFDPLGYHKAQPDILKDFVAGDPATYGDMWRWDSPDSAANEDAPNDVLVNPTNKETQTKKIVQIAKDLTVTAQELSAFTPVVPGVGINASSSLVTNATGQLPPEGTIIPNSSKNTTSAAASAFADINECGSSSIRSNSLEGTGEGETDDERLSLQDIPMDEISPEPAGSDFYDSDTESFLSLSVEDGDTASVNSAGGSQREYGRKYRYRKVLVPSQDQLQSLQLLDGENEVAFDLPGCPPPLRTQLFVWPPDARVVIIDIEGAITAVQKGGLGWGGFLGGSSRTSALHDGVVKLLNNIHKNGYRILYIAQTQTNSSGVAAYSTLSTKEHLAKVVAGLEGKLPPGPVIKSPDSLVRAFGAERTDVFKAAALR